MEKLIALLAISTIFFLLSCSKNEEKVIEKLQEKQIVYEATGTITGQDLTLCACCGGWKLVIDNVVLPTNTLPDYFRFQTLPANSNINLANATFPLKVKFNWSVDNNTCNGNFGRIIIDDIILN